jgi:phytoene desaturase
MAAHIIIIGGGVGGLAAAIRLAAGGRRVTLIEKNPRVGGKLNLWDATHPARPDDRSFRFDTGPSLLTLPFVFDELLAVAGVKIADVLPLKRLDPIARFSWGDGARFELRAHEHDRRDEIQRFAPADAAGWKKFCQRGQNIWNLTADLFLYHAPEQVIRQGGKLAPAAALKMLSTPFRIGMFSAFASAVDGSIKNQKLREVLYQYATYSGASPFKAPATLAVIPHAEMHFGGWYPVGGMYKIAEVLETVARRLGVQIHLNTAVREIIVEGARSFGGPANTDSVAEPTRARPDEPDLSAADIAAEVSRLRRGAGSSKTSRPRAVGVRLSDGQEIRADAVVANSDVVYTYRRLIDEKWRPHFTDHRLDALDPGGSGMVLMLGVEGTYPQLAHHNKFMPDDYRGDLTAMFESHATPDDPCIYVCASTRSDPTQAPRDCENLFVLASAPVLAVDADAESPAPGNFAPDHPVAVRPNPSARHSEPVAADWTTLGPAYRDRLLATLETKWGLTDLRRRIVVQRTMTPADLQSAYNANRGSIYGIGSNSRRAAFLRPPNRDARIAGLYFAGGATHPGGGLPLVALSGKIVSELVMEDF